MRVASPNLSRSLAVAVGVVLCSAAMAVAPALAHHDDDAPPTDGAATFTGAGGGWNGSSWRDAQQGTAADTWTPAQAAEVQVRDLNVDRPAISPNADGEGDEAFVSFRARRTSARVRVQVLDAAGAVVRTLGEARPGYRARFGWDGTTDAETTVPDGAYRIVLTAVDEATARHDAPDDVLAVEVMVDTVGPTVSARRPTLMQLTALARRAGQLRDARRAWAAKYAHRGHGNGHRRSQRHGNGHGNGNGNGMSRSEREWVRLWESRQLRLPVTFTTVEDGDVRVTARVGGRDRSVDTWRTAGRHTLDVVLPTYESGKELTLTFETSDDAGNAHRHTVVSRLPAMPAPRPVRRSTSDDDRGGSGGGGSAAPVTGVPTSTGGPFPDWLDPIMLRATYGAGVPQSWARSQALANLVFRESSYRPTAQNPTSTAYGLFQFLDQTWATVGCRKTSDAYQQSVCGLKYVQRRYRTPERAWAFWQANHWY